MPSSSDQGRQAHLSPQRLRQPGCTLLSSSGNMWAERASMRDALLRKRWWQADESPISHDALPIMECAPARAISVLILEKFANVSATLSTSFAMAVRRASKRQQT